MGHAAEIGDALSQAERFRRMEVEFDEAACTRKIYTKGSEQLQGWVKGLWYKYCQMTGKDALETLRAMPTAVVHSFFYWLLEQRCETLRSASTLQTYWNTFCIIRKTETGCVMIDPTIKSQMCGVRQRLAQEFRLQTEKRPKPIMRAEDEFELLKTLWTSPEFTLDHERLRVQLALILQLAGITGNRPGALLGLRYEHLKLTLLRDPAGSEWPRLLIELTFKHTKGYLGLKDANTFGIPDVPSEPCLLLCPQILLLSLVFADEAFAAPGLTGPEELFRLRVPAGLNQLELPIKDSKTGVPLFRRLENTVHGVVVSATAPATDNWLRGRLSTLGGITGFEHVVKPYCFRRGNGEALDSSSLISDAQRNLILQHASSAVFQHNYLSRYITQDTHAIYRGLAPQTEVMRAASGMTRTIDPRRPRALNETQVAQIARHPEVKLLHRTRKSLVKKIRAEYGTSSRARGTQLYEAYQRVDRQHQNKRKAVYKIIMADILQRYRKQRSAMDIASQLERSPIKRDEKTPSKVQPCGQLSEERNCAVKALFTFATSDHVEECRRRANAVNAVSALSRSQKPIERKMCRAKSACVSTYDGDVSMDLPREVKAPQDPFPIECAPTQCIFCIGKADLHIDERLKTFRNRDGLRRHFHRKHLRHYANDQPISCPHPKCPNVNLANLMHLQNHAARVHKTMT